MDLWEIKCYAYDNFLALGKKETRNVRARKGNVLHCKMNLVQPRENEDKIQRYALLNRMFLNVTS